MPIVSSRGAASAKGFGFTGGPAASCFVCATGGTVTTCGDYKVHTFTGPGTFTINKDIKNPANAKVDYLVVAGGGSAGGNGGGGGGAGGFRVSNEWGLPAPTMSPLANPTGIPVTKTAFPITVGAGGAQVNGNDCSPIPESGNPGNASIFSTITSAGGGGAGNSVGGNPNPGGTALPGGAGGGGALGFPPGAKGGGTGNTPPTSPPQGANGGNGARNPPCNWGGGGGGGGASADGSSFPSGFPGPNSLPSRPGGDGSFISPSFAGLNGTTGPTPGVRYFSGGGAAGSITQFGGPGSGGAGGGGAGGAYTGGSFPPPSGSAGTANTGGGGGANQTPGSPSNGLAGGSGIVLIRYKFQ